MGQVPPHPHLTPSPEKQTQTLHKPGKGSTADLHPQPSANHLLKQHSHLHPSWFPFKHTTWFGCPWTQELWFQKGVWSSYVAQKQLEKASTVSYQILRPWWLWKLSHLCFRLSALSHTHLVLPCSLILWAMYQWPTLSEIQGRPFLTVLYLMKKGIFKLLKFMSFLHLITQKCYEMSKIPEPWQWELGETGKFSRHARECLNLTK